MKARHRQLRISLGAAVLTALNLSPAAFAAGPTVADDTPLPPIQAPKVPSAASRQMTTAPLEPSAPHGRHDPHATLDPDRLIKVALQHEREGRLELALKTLADGIEKFPTAAQLYAVRASLRLQMRQVSAALRDLERAAELDPADAGIRVNRAQAYRSFGRFDEAMADLDFAVAQAPDLLPARFNRGALLYAQNRFEQALADFDHAVAVDPHQAAPYFNRASTYWELGRAEAAMQDLERFLELSGNAQWNQAAEDLLENWQAALAREAAAAGTDS